MGRAVASPEDSMSASQSKQLEDLLVDGFSVDELRALVQGDARLEHLDKSLPTGEVTPERMSHELCRLLYRHGHVEAPFFELLLSLRPQRAESIRAVAESHGFTTTAVPASHMVSLPPKRPAPAAPGPWRCRCAAAAARAWARGGPPAGRPHNPGRQTAVDIEWSSGDSCRWVRANAPNRETAQDGPGDAR